MLFFQILFAFTKQVRDPTPDRPHLSVLMCTANLRSVVLDELLQRSQPNYEPLSPASVVRWRD